MSFLSRGSVALAVIVAAFVATARPALAGPEEKKTAALTYASAPGCPDEAAFRQRVAVHLGYDPFVEGAARAIDVKIVSNGKRLTATTRLKTPGKNDSTRKLDEANDHCDALTDAVAASAATVIDPVRAGGSAAPGAPAVKEKEEVVKVEAGSAASMTRLRIESDRPDNELIRHIGTSYGTGYANGQSVSVTAIHLERVCRLPCTADVPTESTYLVNGPGMAGRAFSIPPNTKQMTAHVKGADGWPLVLALYGGVGGGGAAFLTGGLLWALEGDSSWAALTVVGGAVLVGGIVALVMLPKTHVESSDGSLLDASAKAKAKAKANAPHLTMSGLVF